MLQLEFFNVLLEIHLGIILKFAFFLKIVSLVKAKSYVYKMKEIGIKVSVYAS